MKIQEILKKFDKKLSVKKLRRYWYIILLPFAFLFLFAGVVLHSQASSLKPITKINPIAINITPLPSPTDIPTPTATPTPTIAPTIAPSPTLAPTQAPVVNNTPPGSGFSRQYVSSDMGSFSVNVIAADLNSTRVIVDTASQSDCANNCPAIPLADYVARNGAWAGINGTYFCPPDYAECASKVNSFDTLLMNKNKTYFNSDNNKYSTVPLVYTTGNTFGVRSQSLDWGRDTSEDMVLAMQPLLVQNGNVVYGGSDIAKYNAPGVRSFIANKGSMVYIGEVLGATMEQGAHVLKAMGMDNALNLDEGGSTALWFGGSYIMGPGRALPNAVLFLHK